MANNQRRSTLLMVSLLFLLAAGPNSATRTPPTLMDGELFTLPPKAPRGGVVALVAEVSEQGRLVDIRVLAPSAPFTPLMEASLKHWRYRPATEDEQPSAERVLVLGIFRPPTLYSREGESTTVPEITAAERVPTPIHLETPAHPAKVPGSGTSILELTLSPDSDEPKVRLVTTTPGFGSESVEAAQKLRFATDSLEHETNVYLVFGYPTPWLSEKPPGGR